MSQMLSVQRAVVAAALTVAAAPFAIGGELPAWLARPVVASAVTNPVSTEQPLVTVARLGKSDRAEVTKTGIESQTFAIQVDGMTNSSVLVRVVTQKPVRRATDRSGPTPPSRGNAGTPRMACEPVVSMLTEVARSLAPGRCVT